MRKQQRGQEVEIDVVDELHFSDSADVQPVTSEQTERLQKALLLLRPEEQAHCRCDSGVASGLLK